jgi:pimeloyl-ACP methyl ester carboxylesterase
MSIVAVAAIAVAVFLVASWLHYRYWVARFTVDLPYELEEKIPTEDGCAVELRRLPASEDHGRQGRPVLLVHGLALNHRNNDMSEDLSLGRYLARQGRDVWLLTLRSGREDLSWAEERNTTFEKMARYDLPLGVEEVLSRTGQEQLDYVGFSMGGMLLYASAGRFVSEDKLSRVVIIGSPARIRPPLAMLATVARFVPHWLVPTLRLRIVSNLVAFAAEWVHTPIHHWVYNPENVDRGVAAHSLVNGFVNIPSGLAAEFVRWASDGEAVRYEGTPVTDSLRRIGAPALFVAGAADRLAPPDAVALAFDAWGADLDGVVKRMRIAGIEHGCAADYGHGDLAIGRFAVEDVFEPVADFLSENLEAEEGRGTRA